MTGTPVDRFRELIFARAVREVHRLKETMLLAHYTTAENALKILNGGEIWLRQASLMNDFREVEYGRQCVDIAIRTEPGLRLANAIEGTFPGLWRELVDHFEQMLRNARNTTYLASFCEHDPSDRMGALSMWRAYGGKAGVAILFDPKFVLADDGINLGVSSSPVIYGKDQFFIEFSSFIRDIIGNIDLLASLPRPLVKDDLFTAMQFTALSTKHFGFKEEREWRVIHLPIEMQSSAIKQKTELIGGIPQIVASLPLCPRDNLSFPYTLDQIIYRVIVGPSPYASEIAEALCLRMRELGILNPEHRVFFSDIPLRQG